MKRLLPRLLLLVVTLLIGLVAAELVVRNRERDIAADPPKGYITDEDGVELTAEVIEQRRCMLAVPGSPRARFMFLPGMKIKMCYTGPAQPYFDEDGCVEVQFNSCSIRDREELCAPKPPGGKRVVCIGDSFTFGWGVRFQDAWPTLVEQQLRAQLGDHVRTVNCGASGTLFVDEYALGLRERFGQFEPDVVLVSLCLNDLLKINGGLSHRSNWDKLAEENAAPDAPWWSSRLLANLTATVGPRPMPPTYHLDPEVDWVKRILNIPADHKRYTEKVGRQHFWAGGGPQQGLREMRDWCAERGVTFLVAIWPLFQGLADDEYYPFQKMHDLVAEFCAAESIPLLDLLPTFRGQPSTTALWVSPIDEHGNHIAQRLAAGPIADFVAEHGGL